MQYLVPILIIITGISAIYTAYLRGYDKGYEKAKGEDYPDKETNTKVWSEYHGDWDYAERTKHYPNRNPNHNKRN